MNGKKAEMLRAQAQRQTVGKPATAYGIIERTHPHRGVLRILVLAPCTRRAYKFAKRFYKTGKYPVGMQNQQA